MADYIYPVPFGGVSSFRTHLKVRSTPSVEPGVDLYCPIGTTVVAPFGGYIAEIGGSINAATGLYLTLNLDPDSFGIRRRVRFLHLSSRLRSSGRVNQGDAIALSGATGYGSTYFGEDPNNPDGVRRANAETGGPHVHVTLWPSYAEAYNNGRSRDFDGSLDFQEYASGNSGSAYFVPPPTGDTDMILARRESNNGAYIIVPNNYIKHVPDENEERLVKYATTGLDDTFAGLNDRDFSILLWAWGFPELGGGNDHLPVNGEYYFAPART